MLSIYKRRHPIVIFVSVFLGVVRLCRSVRNTLSGLRVINEVAGHMTRTFSCLIIRKILSKLCLLMKQMRNNVESIVTEVN